jgi:hypothetical protein
VACDGSTITVPNPAPIARANSVIAINFFMNSPLNHQLVDPREAGRIAVARKRPHSEAQQFDEHFGALPLVACD